MDSNYIKKLYLNAYQKYVYNLKEGHSELTSYYTGQVKMLEDSFGEYLGTTEEIEALRQKAEANAIESIEYYTT